MRSLLRYAFLAVVGLLAAANIFIRSPTFHQMVFTHMMTPPRAQPVEPVVQQLVASAVPLPFAGSMPGDLRAQPQPELKEFAHRLELHHASPRLVADFLQRVIPDIRWLVIGDRTVQFSVRLPGARDSQALDRQLARLDNAERLRLARIQGSASGYVPATRKKLQEFADWMKQRNELDRARPRNPEGWDDGYPSHNHEYRAVSWWLEEDRKWQLEGNVSAVMAEIELQRAKESPQVVEYGISGDRVNNAVGAVQRLQKQLDQVLSDSPMLLGLEECRKMLGDETAELQAKEQEYNALPMKPLQFDKERQSEVSDRRKLLGERKTHLETILAKFESWAIFRRREPPAAPPSQYLNPPDVNPLVLTLPSLPEAKRPGIAFQNDFPVPVELTQASPPPGPGNPLDPPAPAEPGVTDAFIPVPANTRVAVRPAPTRKQLWTLLETRAPAGSENLSFYPGGKIWPYAEVSNAFKWLFVEDKKLQLEQNSEIKRRNTEITELFQKLDSLQKAGGEQQEVDQLEGKLAQQGIEFDAVLSETTILLWGPIIEQRLQVAEDELVKVSAILDMWRERFPPGKGILEPMRRPEPGRERIAQLARQRDLLATEKAALTTLVRFQAEWNSQPGLGVQPQPDVMPGPQLQRQEEELRKERSALAAQQAELARQAELRRNLPQLEQFQSSAESLRAQMEARHAELLKLESQFGSNHARIIEGRQEIEAMQKALQALHQLDLGWLQNPGLPPEPKLMMPRNSLEASSLELAEKLKALPEDQRRAQAGQLRDVVTKAFEARQAQQQAELESLQNRLQQVHQSVEARARDKQRIIDKRVEELLNPNLKWETSKRELETKPVATPVQMMPQLPNTFNTSLANELAGVWEMDGYFDFANRPPERRLVAFTNSEMAWITKSDQIDVKSVVLFLALDNQSPTKGEIHLSGFENSITLSTQVEIDGDQLKLSTDNRFLTFHRVAKVLPDDIAALMWKNQTPLNGGYIPSTGVGVFKVVQPIDPTARFIKYFYDATRKDAPAIVWFQEESGTIRKVPLFAIFQSEGKQFSIWAGNDKSCRIRSGGKEFDLSINSMLSERVPSPYLPASGGEQVAEPSLSMAPQLPGMFNPQPPGPSDLGRPASEPPQMPDHSRPIIDESLIGVWDLVGPGNTSTLAPPNTPRKILIQKDYLAYVQFDDFHKPTTYQWRGDYSVSGKIISETVVAWTIKPGADSQGLTTTVSLVAVQGMLRVGTFGSKYPAELAVYTRKSAELPPELKALESSWKEGTALSHAEIWGEPLVGLPTPRPDLPGQSPLAQAVPDHTLQGLWEGVNDVQNSSYFPAAKGMQLIVQKDRLTLYASKTKQVEETWLYLTTSNSIAGEQATWPVEAKLFNENGVQTNTVKMDYQGESKGLVLTISPFQQISQNRMLTFRKITETVPNETVQVIASFTAGGAGQEPRIPQSSAPLEAAEADLLALTKQATEFRIRFAEIEAELSRGPLENRQRLVQELAARRDEHKAFLQLIQSKLTITQREYEAKLKSLEVLRKQVNLGQSTQEQFRAADLDVTKLITQMGMLKTLQELAAMAGPKSQQFNNGVPNPYMQPPDKVVPNVSPESSIPPSNAAPGGFNQP